MPCKSQTRWDIDNCDGDNIKSSLGVDWSVEFTVGAEAADVINVALQVVDAAGADLEEQKSFTAWLSDTAAAAVTTTAPDTAVDIGTDGTILMEHMADVWLELITEADGDLDIDIEESGIDTWYLNVRLANGDVVSSAAITFA